MALTVGTNSYIDREDADGYFAYRLYSDDWAGAINAHREMALLMARRMLDQQSFLGHLSDDDQLMAWPRSDILGVDSGSVPQAIIDAQCELALAFLKEDLTADDGTRGVRRMQAGSVSIEYDVDARVKRLPDAVTALIKPFLAEPETTNSIRIVM
jgi:hypothetical protein